MKFLEQYDSTSRFLGNWWFWITCIFVSIVAYAVYASVFAKQGVFLDDHVLWMQAARDPMALFDPSENFQRFFSRGVYWLAMSSIFGEEAQVYFSVNALLVVVSAFSFLFFAKRVFDQRSVLVLLLIIYLFNAFVIRYNLWISYQQHIIPQIFLWGYLATVLGHGSRRELVSTLLLLLGLASNQYVVVAPILAAIFLWAKNDVSSRWKMLAGHLLLCVIWVLVSKSIITNQSDHYKIEFAMGQIIANSAKYSEMIYGRGYQETGTIVTAVLFLSCLAARARLATAFVYAAIVVILPFMFLKYRTDAIFLVNYIVFLCCALVALIVNQIDRQWERIAHISLLVGLVLFASYDMTSYWRDNPFSDRRYIDLSDELRHVKNHCDTVDVCVEPVFDNNLSRLVKHTGNYAMFLWLFDKDVDVNYAGKCDALAEFESPGMLADGRCIIGLMDRSGQKPVEYRFIDQSGILHANY